MNKVILFILGAALLSCKERQSATFPNQVTFSPKYAKGFWVENKGNYKDVFVRQSGDSNTAPIRYRLVQKNSQAPIPEENVNIIYVPVASIVCTSTTHIPLLDYLGETEKLVGFPSTQYISSTKARERIDKGLVKELGIDNSMNIELLTQLQPSLVMAYSMSSDLGQLKKVQELNIPVVINAEFLEQHPLGRAEWIKFMALFFNKEEKGDSIFTWIESEYLKAKSVTESFKEKPTILTGIPYGGTWYLPGGQNYAARFFEDAGCKYLWEDDASNGFLKLSLETVYERASKADYWIGLGSFETYEELLSTDDRFAKFSPFPNRKIYNYNKRIGSKGGNEYLELGYLRPDLILKDLIQITHPTEYPEPDLFFYKALK
jgi:iron complex transport system substrate-binding protein